MTYSLKWLFALVTAIAVALGWMRSIQSAYNRGAAAERDAIRDELIDTWRTIGGHEYRLQRAEESLDILDAHDQINEQIVNGLIQDHERRISAQEPQQ